MMFVSFKETHTKIQKNEKQLFIWFHEKVIVNIAICINQQYSPTNHSPRKYLIFRDNWKSSRYAIEVWTSDLRSVL